MKLDRRAFLRGSLVAGSGALLASQGIASRADALGKPIADASALSKDGGIRFPEG